MLHGGFATAAAMKKPSTEVKTSTSLLHTVYSGTYVQENHTVIICVLLRALLFRKRSTRDYSYKEKDSIVLIRVCSVLEQALVGFHSRIDM
jgi:hypothetical protein